MTVATSSSSQTFAGGQQNLTFTFRALTSFPNYINVSVVALTGGSVTALSYGTQYTVTISSTGVGGTVIVTPSYGTNYNYVVYRSTAALQPAAYANYNTFPASTLEGGLDQLTMIAQEQNTANSLIIQYPIGTSTTYSTIMPIPSIGCVVTCNSGGTNWIASAGIAGPVGPSGSTGPISSVSSSTSDVTIVSTSTTPILTAVNAGTGSSQLVRLTSSAFIPTNSVSGLLGAWNSVSFSTVYQATTDLFVMASATSNAIGSISLLTDSNPTPSTTRITETGLNLNIAVSGFIKKNDYYKILLGSSASSISIYTISVGN